MERNVFNHEIMSAHELCQVATENLLDNGDLIDITMAYDSKKLKLEILYEGGEICADLIDFIRRMSNS